MKVTAVKTMLMAQDMSRAVAFYQQVFAFELGYSDDFWSELKWRDAIVALHGGHDGTVLRTNLSIEVDDIVSAASRVENQGGSMVLSPMRREGEPIIYSEFKDPEGNIVMLTQYLEEDEVAAADLLA